MTSSDPDPRGTYVCPKCFTGTMQLRRVSYAHWYGGQFITIPNFPSWVCDVCGEREYDSVAQDQVETILGAELDLRREAGRRARRGARRPAPFRPPSGRRLD